MVDVVVPRAEAFSFWTHVAGAAVAVVGSALLVLRAGGTADALALSVYGVTLVLVFVASALHHARIPGGERTRLALKRFDHISIFMFIAGTYTPVCLLAFPAAEGLPLLALVWGLAIVGTLLKLARRLSRRWTSVVVYVAMGWAAVLGADRVIEAFPPAAVALLVGGGLVYTLGGIVYARGWPDPWRHVVGAHGVWHVFVLVGAALHFGFIFGYVAGA